MDVEDVDGVVADIATLKHDPSCSSSAPPPDTAFVSARIDPMPPINLPMGSVVRFFVTSAARSYTQPWVVQKEIGTTGTGFIIAGNLILTNAHVVTDSTVVEVKKQGEPRRYRAQVLCVGHDVDLALVGVEDKRFWENPPLLRPVDWAARDCYPELYSEVRAVGFPTGGNTVCVTKGVISRVDAHLYVHPRMRGVFPGTENSPGNLPIIQIDAAINPGNSGGPAFDLCCNVVGVASSGLPKAQNVGYIIPAKVVLMFLDEYLTTTAWAGVCETGIRAEKLESEAMREYLQMGERTGVRIRSVANLGAAAGKVLAGDILLEVDDLVVSSEGTVPHKVGTQDVDMPFDVMITQKPKESVTKIKLFRGTDEVVEDITFRPIPPLAPRFDRYDCCPEYVILGGLVFTKHSVPLISEYFHMQRDQRRFSMDSETLEAGTDCWKQTEEQEVILLLKSLKHSVNLGYSCHKVRILLTFNGEKVTTLASLAAAAEAVLDCENAPSCDFLRFGFARAQPEGTDSIVLRAAEVRAADAEICKSHRIATPVQLNCDTKVDL